MVRVQDIMTRDVLTVDPRASIEAAWERMRAKGVHHLVVSQAGDVLGVVSERDLRGLRRNGTRSEPCVEQVMSPKPATVPPEMPVRRAANLMRGRSVGSLVVVDAKGALAGIITVSDLLDAVGRGVSRPATVADRPTLNHRVPHRKRHSGTGTW